jgi:hypothetical protein
MRRRKREQLVCQMLERLGAKALEEHQGIIRRYVRGRHGVYALYRNERLYYVGLARNLHGRLRQHLRDRHRRRWDRFSVYLTVGDSFVKEMESLLLRIARPQGNKLPGKFIRCEDLRRRFKRDYAADSAERFRQLVGRPQADVISVADGQPLLRQYVTRATPLRGTYKGNLYKARVQKNGAIRFRGRVFNSPSAAASTLRKGMPCNGWSFWRYERAPGDWVPLSEIRRNR